MLHRNLNLPLSRRRGNHGTQLRPGVTTGMVLRTFGRYFSLTQSPNSGSHPFFRFSILSLYSSGIRIMISFHCTDDITSYSGNCAARATDFSYTILAWYHKPYR